MKTLNILSFSLILILHISIDLRSQEIPDHRAENYIPQERDFSQFPLNLNSNTTNTWEQLHPTIPRVDYWGVYFIDTATGFAVGDGGALIKTIDGGLTWRTIESGVTTLLRTIGSYDGSVIVAAGDLGKIIISTDVGETWTELQSVVPHNLWNIQFVTEQIGWLVGWGSSALKTTDGGFTWVNQQTPLIGYPYWDVSFYDTSFGYICTNIGGILRTTDGGLSWDVQMVGGDNINLFAIKVITRQKAVSMGGVGKKVYTSDGGNSWQLIDYFGGDSFLKIDFIDTLTGFAVAFADSYFTTNGGMNWAIAPGMSDGRDITFVNENTGYLVSRQMIIHKTTNTAQSWESLVVKDDIVDVAFTSAKEGWFIGRDIDPPSRFTFYKTTDGGNTLIPQIGTPWVKPSSVYFLDSLIGIVGAENKMFKTINGGVTWQEKKITSLPGNGGAYDKIFFINDNTGWAKSNLTQIPFSSYIIKTTNAGETWNFQIESDRIIGIHFSDPNNGWATRTSNNNNGKPLRTFNGGETWIEQINFSLGDTWDVFFIDNEYGFITNREFVSPPPGSGRMYKTSNGGLNWWEQDTNIVRIGQSRFSNLLNNTIFLSGNLIFKSSDNGETWNEVLELRGTRARYTRQFNYSEKFDVSVGDLGLIMRFNDSLLLNKGDNRIEHPKGFHLHQNYPNPFNTETIIMFEIPKKSVISIKVYDSTGREIKELVNREFYAGHHTTLFDAKDFASGIYFYKIEVNNFTETKKMVLTK